MTVRYHAQRSVLVPTYWCGRRLLQRGERHYCQTVHGGTIDRVLGDLLVDMVTPLAIDVALAVQQELLAREEEADRLRRQQVERARYEADLAERRFLRVDPDHRLVADALEADWNAKLRALAAAQEQYEQTRAEQTRIIGEAERSELLALATDFPRLWRDPKTSARDKKRMVRLLITDVTLIQDRQVTAQIRFRGGATRTLTISRPLSRADQCRTSGDVIGRIDQLLEEYTDQEIAEKLNREGLCTGTGLPFDAIRVARVRSDYKLKSRYRRLREKGMLTVQEMATRLGVIPQTVRKWRAAGLLSAHPYSSKNESLYEPPGSDGPRKGAHKGLSAKRRARNTVTSNG